MTSIKYYVVSSIMKNFMCPLKHMWIKWLTSFAKAQAGSLCILSWVVIITQSDNFPLIWPEQDVQFKSEYDQVTNRYVWYIYNNISYK